MKNLVIVQPFKFSDIRQDKIIKSFVEKGYIVHILFSKKNENKVSNKMYNNEKIKKNIIYYNLNTKIPINIPFNLCRNIKINKIIDTINPEILICRDIFMSGFISKKHIYKSYIDICDNFPEVLECLFYKPLNLVSKAIANYYENRAINRFKNVIFVSKDSANYVLNKHNLQDKRYFVLENTPSTKQLDIKFKDKEFDFIYIGTINKKIRDIDSVINAMELNLQKGFDFKFDVYYFKNQIKIINHYKEIIKQKKLQNNIRFYESVPLEKLPDILSNYKCGLVPHCRNKATDYTIPNKLYDYLKQGLKVITSDNPSLVYFCKELKVTENYIGEDYKSLSETMIRLLEKNCDFENRLGIKLINNYLNWEKCFEDFYKNVEEKV